MKILIVEDDPSSRLYLENLLEINNYNFKSADNGINGLNIFDEYKPDIVLTDIQMPVMNGLELLEAIRKKKSDTIVIITTAFGSENYAVQALELGANNYIKKPITSIDLLPLLAKYNSKIKSKFSLDKLPGCLINKKFEIKFKSSMSDIPKIVDRVLIESACDFDDSIRINVELGLVELITNAIEHGNLEISYNEKQDALDNNKFEELIKSRMENEKLKKRKIKISFCENNSSYEWIIADEGSGFNWESLPNPTDQDNILELNGRGVFISNFLFDSIEYYGNGNTVKAIKNRNIDKSRLK